MNTRSMHSDVFPFSAIVGQEALKLTLMLNAIHPRIGGVLIRGEKGTAKSTTVRALAALLPQIEVVVGCPYSCFPNGDDGHCEACRNASRPLKVVSRSTRVVTLPLNATEDRVAGGIDFNQSVKTGKRVLQPGLLARSHRGILYVDEVNLLDDHLVDIILDAAASGENRIEREGLSFRHPSAFMLVGTMNPEEGELRPQLLDRFGLCVEVTAETDPENRILMMQRREEYDADHHAFCETWTSENEILKSRIMAAKDLLPTVRMPKYLRTLITELCTENNVAGHRADLIIEQAARAHAAFHQRTEVTVEDIKAVAPFALTHRKRDAAPPPPPPPEKEDQEPEQDHSETDDAPEENEPEAQEPENAEEDPPDREQDAPDEAPLPADGNPSDDGEETDAADSPSEPDGPDQNPPENNPPEKNSDDVREQLFAVGETFKVKKIVTPKDRIFRRGSGRRSRTRVSQKQGRYVKSSFTPTGGDIALDATLRAAAPHQQERRRQNRGLAVYLQPQDIRGKIREKRIGNFLLFVVDASGSMGARGRMAASKGAIMSLLLDAYQKRDRVAMVSFRRQEAFVNLPPTSSIELAANLLTEMPVGGRTPLSAGLAKSYEVLRNHLLREPTARPIIILITDGKSNVSLGDQKPVEEALNFVSKMALDERIRFVVVDTEQEGLIQFGLAAKLAAACDADYFKIENLKADSLLAIVKGES